MLRAPVESLPGTTFFHSSPVLDQATAHETYARWWGGKRVLSSPVSVGHVAMTTAQERALGGYDMFKTNYTLLPEDHPAVRPFEEVTRAFLSVVRFDTERGGLGDEIRHRIFGGYYRDVDTLSGERVHLQDWHSDDPRRIEVRWLLCCGVAPTRGAEGEFSRADIVQTGENRGDLLPGVLGTSLHPREYEPGTVLRIMMDVHASGRGIGNRLLNQATAFVPPLAA